MEPKAHFVGKESCRECHLTEYNDWVGSDHDKAMAVATDSTVLGDFSDVEVQSNGRANRMYKDNGKFMVYTDGEDGKMHDFEVKYVFGHTPLQQYLIEFPGGRLQTLPITWNTLDSVWYSMVDSIYQDEVVDADNWLHWTNQAQNWNSMCADCHSTNLVKGYDFQADTFHTTWSEINVSCEACHGAGSRHVEWANLPEYSRTGYTNSGLEVKTSGIDQVQYVDNCVRCHSRRSALGHFDLSARSPYDHTIPNLPDEPTWHIDGQILDEDYVYASFLQSRMYMKEVQCNDCHNVHSGERLFDGNDLCYQCHKKDVYGTPEHHFHKDAGMEGEAVVSESGVVFEVGSGTECINCHMHGQYYMGVDFRNDHSFRIPRPDLSIKNGTLNACNQCHADKSNEWSESYITKWYGQRRRYHFSQAFAAAKELNPEAATELKNIVSDELYPPNIRSLAIQHLGNYFQDSLTTIREQYLNDLNPSLRLATVRGIHLQSQAEVELMLPLLLDETKALRTEAVRVLIAIGEEQIPQKYKEPYRKALEEYKQVLIYNAEFPNGKFGLANFYYNQNDLKNAEKFYLAALKQDKELHYIKLNLATLYNRMKQNDKAELLFKDYLKYEPDNADALYSYGLLLSEMGKYDESLNRLLEAAAKAPDRPRVHHNIAMMYDFMDKKTEAERFLKKEIAVVNDLNSNLELLKYYIDNKQTQKALDFATQLQKQFPDAQEVKQVIEGLRQQR
jgi:tetratricopeptide (TPR) repeat protein